MGLAEGPDMSGFGEGFAPYLILVAIAALAHEPWRWLGLLLGRTLTLDSEVFVWVRAVSTALIAALVMRLVLFPAGELAAAPMLVRILAVAAGVAAFFTLGRNIAIAVGTGSATLGVLILASRALA
jgi:branched-subunit amino acid transport protein